MNSYIYVGLIKFYKNSGCTSSLSGEGLGFSSDDGCSMVYWVASRYAFLSRSFHASSSEVYFPNSLCLRSSWVLATTKLTSSRAWARGSLKQSLGSSCFLSVASEILPKTSWLRADTMDEDDSGEPLLF